MSKQDKQFNNFKIHTQYSICEGAIKIEELAEYSKYNQIKSLGICDSFNLCGALEFSEKISKSGTQPIIGTQINFKIDDFIGKLPIFATTEEGYKKLTNLSSKSYLDIKEIDEPHCSIEYISSDTGGLILLSGNQYNFFGKLFSANKIKLIEEIFVKLKKSFKDNLYLEIQRHGESGETIFENFLISLSIKFNLPLIASQEIFYIKKDMAEAHDALICIGEKRFVDDKNRIKLSNEHFLKSYEDYVELFKDIPEALENNLNFPLRFSFKLKKSIPILPSLKTTNNISIESELLNQAKEGLANRLENFVFKKNNTDKEKIKILYEDRLLHEIEIINSMNYPSYFLIVSDYIKWSKKIIFQLAQVEALVRAL